jgi:hypothetical protein
MLCQHDIEKKKTTAKKRGCCGQWKRMFRIMFGRVVN